MNELKSGYHFGIQIKKGLNVNKHNEVLTDDFYKPYDSGFHCFSGCLSDNKIDNGYLITRLESIVEIIIPKGSKVTYGKQIDGQQSDMVTIVTDRFILPVGVKSIIKKIKSKWSN